MTVRENIQYAIITLVDKEGSPSKFAKKVGSTKQAVSNWVSGKNAPDIEKIADIADAYSVKMSDILEGGLDYEIDSISEPNPAFINLPVLGEIAAGTPIDMMEINDEHPCPTAIAREHPNSGWLKVKGDSYNKKLPNGCLALVDFDKTEPLENTPFAVCVNGYSATIKNIKQLANGFELIPNSYDPTYTPKIYDYNKDDTEEITIIGQVVYATFPLDWEP
jgi:repressor LexA